MWQKVLIFLGGAAVGGAVVALCMKEYMEREIEAQVEDVKRVYGREQPEEPEEEEKEAAQAIDPQEAKRISLENMKKKDDLFHVEKLVTTEGYRKNYNLFSSPLPEEEVETGDDDEDEQEEDYPKEGVNDRPYVISQEEFINGNKYYDKTTLNYYDDGILEDEITEEIIEDIDAVVGYGSLTKFGEYEDDVVFVRNERLSTDYEVIRQYRDFAQIPKDGPD